MTLAQNKQRLKYALQNGSVPVYETDDNGNIIYYEDSDGNRIPMETGETTAGYSKPVVFFGNIAMSGGEIKDQEYGLSVADYDAVLIMAKDEIPITETSRIWFESEVGYKQRLFNYKDILKDSKGNDILDSNGRQIISMNGSSTEIVDGDTADFRVLAIKPSLNTVKYVLGRINK